MKKTIVITAVLACIFAGNAFAASKIAGWQIRKNTITGAHIRNHSLTGLDIKNKSITAADIRNGQVTGAAIRPRSVTLKSIHPDTQDALVEEAADEAATTVVEEGNTGPMGPQGPKGDKGDPDKYSFYPDRWVMDETNAVSSYVSVAKNMSQTIFLKGRIVCKQRTGEAWVRVGTLAAGHRPLTSIALPAVYGDPIMPSDALQLRPIVIHATGAVVVKCSGDSVPYTVDGIVFQSDTPPDVITH